MSFGPTRPAHRLAGTLRFRIILWVTLLVFGMVLVTMLAIDQVVRRTLAYEYDQILRDDLIEMRRFLREGYPGQKLFRELDRRAQEHEHRNWFVQFYTAALDPLWASLDSPLLPAPAKIAPGEAYRDLGEFRWIETWVDELGRPFDGAADSQPLLVRIGSSRKGIAEDLALVHRIMLLAGVSILVLTPLAGWVLAGRATRPLQWILATTARLQPANLEERLPVRGTGDELDDLSRTLNGMLDRIASYIDRQREFVASAAHELRSPLAAIRSSVEVALNRPRTAEEYTDLLDDVVEECARLGSLVDRLLLLAESDAGRNAFRDGTVRLDRILAESVDMFQAVAESRGVHLAIAECAAAAVPGDDQHLRQVVRNLLENAIKFSPPPGEVVAGLLVDPANRQAILRIADRGLGIPPEDLPHVFDRFFRGDRAREREEGPGGIGLGLSICRSIVDALDGSIEAASTPGQGSTFTVRLPLAAESTIP